MLIHSTSGAPANGAQRPIGALLFDMDGTMIDTRRYHMEAWRELVGQLGLGEREYEVAYNGFGKTNRAIFEAWFGPEGRQRNDFEELGERKEALFRELIAGREQGRPGLKELIDQARRRGLRIALATSAPRSNAIFLIEQLGLARQFDALVWSTPAMQSKPHPDSFLLAARRLGVAPSRCVVFEDSIHGFWSARRAGMRLLAIAERSEDWVRCRMWTPWVMRDFLPATELLGLG